MSGEPFGAFAPSKRQAAVIDLVRATPILRRGTFRPFVAKLLARLREGPVDIERGGVKFRMVFDDNPIEWGIALMPGYEGSELRFLREGLTTGSTVVDIGANIGLYGLSLAPTVGPNGKVLAIEADPVAQGRLGENARLNAWPQVAVAFVAAGDHDGEARFAAKRNFAHSKIAPDGDVVVPMRTLVGILAEHNITRIDALKIDVEGYEDQVLRPFFKTAPRSVWPRRVAIEDIFIDKSADNCVKLMKSLGYREAGRKRINAFLVLDDGRAR
jgi:FkbM family methyltransferase